MEPCGGEGRGHTDGGDAGEASDEVLEHLANYSRNLKRLHLRASHFTSAGLQFLWHQAST